jgi:endonuclease/exonuclease/phosphatase family metal-dependent hydrolase
MTSLLSRLTVALVVGLGGLLGGADSAVAVGAPHLTAATYNVYLGADLLPIASAPTEEEATRRAAAVYQQVKRTDFPARAEAIADVIAENPPDVVGLQEVALWKYGPIEGELTTSYDFLQLLLKALAERGLRYLPVATNTNFSAELPVSAVARASFTDRDVIIARANGPKPPRISHVREQNYTARFVITTPTGRVYVVPRGWSSVDVTVGAGTVRLANTHLEAFSPAIRDAQAIELRTALATSPHPVVLAGDLNSFPQEVAGPYGMFTSTGYADAWVAVHGPAGGFTAGQSANLDNFPSALDHRVDYVFYQSDELQAVAADVIGEEPDDRTPAGLWPSDHAGVVTGLRFSCG